MLGRNKSTKKVEYVVGTLVRPFRGDLNLSTELFLEEEGRGRKRRRRALERGHWGKERGRPSWRVLLGRRVPPGSSS